MDQTLYAFLDLNKSAIGYQIGDLTFDALSGGESLLDLVPRIFLGLFQAE